jgi:hypothetical protein
MLIHVHTCTFTTVHTHTHTLAQSYNNELDLQKKSLFRNLGIVYFLWTIR